MNKNGNTGGSKTGFTKEFYENISNNKLLGITFTKEELAALKELLNSISL